MVKLSRQVLYPMNVVLAERGVEPHNLIARATDEEDLLMIERSREMPTEVILAARDEVRGDLDKYFEKMETIALVVHERRARGDLDELKLF